MAYVVDNALSYGAAVTGVAANVPAHQTGDLLVAYSVMNSGAMTTSSSGWTAMSNNTTAGTSNTSSWTYKVAASATETFTYTTTDDHSLIIVCVRDVDTTTPIDVSSHLGTATSTSTQASVSVTTTTADCLVLYFMGVDGIANSALSDPGVHHLVSMDNGSTTAATATTNAAAWYIQRAAGATPAPTWTCSLAGVAARLTVAIRNKSGGIIPAYIDDSATNATVVTPGHHYSTLNNISFTTTLTSTAAINGKTVTGTAGTAQADLGINPFSSGIGIAAATVARTALNGYQCTLTGNRNWSTGLIMGSFIGGTPKMGTFGIGTVQDGGVVVRIGSAAGAWCAYQVAAKDSIPNLEVRSVWAIEPGYTATSYGTPGTAVTTTAVSHIQFHQNSPYFNSSAILSEVYQVFKIIVAGGVDAAPVDSTGLSEVGRSFRLPVIQKAGGAGVISFAPIQIGGGDSVNFQIDAGALQFPRRYNAATKEIAFHASDNKVGISYAGKTGDVIKHTNSVITSLTRYYWEINSAATNAATWDFTGLVVVNATVTLRNVMVFNQMSFSQCGSITANDCDLTDCAITNPPATSGSLVVNANSSFDNCTFETTTITAGNYLVTVSDPGIFTNCAFIGSGTSGHAIRITTPGTYTFSGNTFTGYGGTPGTNLTQNSGSTSAAILNESGGSVTLSIAGGDSPSVRNVGTGSVTTISASKTFKITNVVYNSELRIFKMSDDSELAGVETIGVTAPSGGSVSGPDANGRYTFTYAHSLNENVKIIVISTTDLGSPSKNYQPYYLEYALSTTADQELLVSQILDRNYTNP